MRPSCSPAATVALDAGHSRRAAGIGLSIVRRLCALYDWDVQVRPGAQKGVVATLAFG